MSVAFVDPPSEHRVVPKRTSEPRDRIDLRVEPKLYARIDHHQRRRGHLGISAYIRQAIVRQLDEDDAAERLSQANVPRSPRGR
jgi:hypothetical protein